MLHRHLQVFDNKIKISVAEEKKLYWNKLLSKQSPGSKKLWNIAKSMKGKKIRIISPLTVNNIQLVTPIEKAQANANVFEKSHLLTTNFHNPTIENLVETCV